MVDQDIATRDEVAELKRAIREMHMTAGEAVSGLLRLFQEMRTAAIKHDKAWLTLLEEELAKRGVNWCSECEKIYAVYDNQFVFITGTEEAGDSESSYWTRDFAKLHHACPACREKFFDRHGMRSAETSFYAFQAEQREGEFQANKFGTWVTLAPEQIKQRPFDFLESARQKEIASACEMPPRLHLAWDGNTNVKLPTLGYRF